MLLFMRLSQQMPWCPSAVQYHLPLHYNTTSCQHHSAANALPRRWRRGNTPFATATTRWGKLKGVVRGRPMALAMRPTLPVPFSIPFPKRSAFPHPFASIAIPAFPIPPQRGKVRLGPFLGQNLAEVRDVGAAALPATTLALRIVCKAGSATPQGTTTRRHALT